MTEFYHFKSFNMSLKQKYWHWCVFNGSKNRRHSGTTVRVFGQFFNFYYFSTRHTFLKDKMGIFTYNSVEIIIELYLQSD